MRSMNFRLGNGTERRKKIKITDLVRLADVLRIKCAIAARITRRGLLPCSAAARNLLVPNVQMNAAYRHVDLDLITGFHESQRAADKTFRSHMENAGAVACAAHARI